MTDLYNVVFLSVAYSDEGTYDEIGQIEDIKRANTPSTNAGCNKNNQSSVSEKRHIAFGNQYFSKKSATNGIAQLARFRWGLNFLKILISEGYMTTFLRHLTDYFCCALYRRS